MSNITVEEKKHKGFTISFSFGTKYGGFNIYNGYIKRLCLGWFAIHVFPKEIEDILIKALNNNTQK